MEVDVRGRVFGPRHTSYCCTTDGIWRQGAKFALQALGVVECVAWFPGFFELSRVMTNLGTFHWDVVDTRRK